MSNSGWISTTDGKQPAAGSTVSVTTPNGTFQGTYAGAGAGVHVPGQGTYWPTTK